MEREGLYDQEAKVIARKAEKIVNLRLTPERFTAHCKGQGLICIK